MRVAAPELESGNDSAVTEFYSSRLTDCAFLSDPQHYEFPRGQWVLGRVSGGSLLEIGSGNGGMTAMLARKVQRLVVLDASRPSLQVVKSLELENVSTQQGLVENYEPKELFDWVVLSEVLEHLRDPRNTLARCLRWAKPGGHLLVTTPNGHWESDEHLHEFDLKKFSALLVHCGAEEFAVSYLRDNANRRRWLIADVTAPQSPAAPDSFNSKWSLGRRAGSQLK